MHEPDEAIGATAEQQQRIRRSRQIAAGVTGFVAVLWLIHLVIFLSGWDRAFPGIYPGRMQGLVGVVTAPLIHGSWKHLISNTLPLWVLATAVIYGTPRAARITIPVIWIGAGLGVWLFARESSHIGASGLVYGLLFYLLIAGILRRDRQSLALTLIAFFLYGGMIWGVFPGEPGISFEYHLFGAIAGSLCAIVLRRRDPLPERKRYDWEYEDIDEDFIDEEDADHRHRDN